MWGKTASPLVLIGGGIGNDIFQFAKVGSSNDTIADFELGDKIQLKGGLISEAQVTFDYADNSFEAIWLEHNIHVDVIGTIPTMTDIFIM